MNRWCVSAAMIVSSFGVAQADTVELLHYWRGPAERAALQVFADSFEERDGKWHDTTRADEVMLKAYAIDRIKSGYSPTAVQWHGGPEIERLHGLEIISPLSDVASGEELASILPSIADILMVDGKVGALPVGLHGGNWMWRNRHIYEELGLDAPRDWEHFLEQAAIIRANGYTPLAIGHSAWERATLFVAVMLDIAGLDFYQRMLDGSLDAAADGEKLEEVFHLLLRLRDEATNPAQAYEIWSKSTYDVIEGRAAAQVMGDWAKGEFLNADKRVGEDFDCMIAPGNNDVLTIILDIFVLPKPDGPDMQKAQAMLADVVLDPDIQQRFSLTKGSLPVVKAVDMQEFDACAQYGFEVVSGQGGGVPSMSLSMTQERIAEIHGTVQMAWEEENVSMETLKDIIFQ